MLFLSATHHGPTSMTAPGAATLTRQPEARRYEVSLVSELVGKYDVDGLSLDYCRCPNRVGYTDSGRAEFLKKHNVDLAKIVGADPEALDTEGGKKAASSMAASARANPIWPEWRKMANRADQRPDAGDSHRGQQGETRPADLQLRLGLPHLHEQVRGLPGLGHVDQGRPAGLDQSLRLSLYGCVVLGSRAPQPGACATGFPFYITIGVKTSHGSLKDAAEIRKQITMAASAAPTGSSSSLGKPCARSRGSWPVISRPIGPKK